MLSYSVIPKTLSLSNRGLLAIYGIVPLCLFAAAIDSFFLDGWLKSLLPVVTPDRFLWWSLIFNLPHIIGSFVTYAEPEYLKSYRAMLLKGFTLSTLIVLVVPMTLGPEVLFAFVSAYTVYHVFMQQFGISLMFLGRRPDWLYFAWRWLTIIGGALFYVEIYFSWANTIELDLVKIGILSVMAGALAGFAFLWRVRRNGGDISRTSTAYFVATILMVPVSVAVFMAGYPFLMILIPRFVHDVTAFAVYAVHDHNRNTEDCRNWLYKPIAFLKIPPVFLNFPFAIAIAGALTLNRPDSIVIGIVTAVLILTHYHMEAHMWKRGSLHRHYTPFRMV